MGYAWRQTGLTEQEYLAAEACSPIRHELVSGRAYAMAGASERHNQMALHIAFHLRAATRGTARKTFKADMRLRQLQGALYSYPDVMLVCDPHDDHPLHKEAPCFIAEVLSPATAATDLREKWLAYQQLPSLRYCLMVTPSRFGRHARCAPLVASGHSWNSPGMPPWR